MNKVKLLVIIFIVSIITGCSDKSGTNTISSEDNISDKLVVNNSIFEESKNTITDGNNIDDDKKIEDNKKTVLIDTDGWNPVSNFSGSVDNVFYDEGDFGTGSSDLATDVGEYTSVSNYLEGSSGSLDEQAAKNKIESKVMLVLDVSGSMAGQIGGETKITTARSVVKKVTQDYDETTQIGLMAYGHNRTGDCSDIETLVFPAKNNASKIAGVVDGLTPTGMTPMGASVQKAAEQMKYSEEKTSIVLVTDGIETCDVNICELGKKLEKEGIDFTAHVISFGVDEKDTKNMQCLAESTGGKYLTADNAETLGDALGEAVSSSTCKSSEDTKINLLFPETVISGDIVRVKFELEGGNQYDKIGFIGEGEDVKITDYIYPKNFIQRKGEAYTYANIDIPEVSGEYSFVYENECGETIVEKKVVVEEAGVVVYAPKTMVAGSQQKVRWNRNTNAKYDKIGFYVGGEEPKVLNPIYPSSTLLRKGETKFRTTIDVPEIPGEYELVYQTDEEKEILFRQTIQVELPRIVLYAPDTMVAGSDQKIRWNRNTNAKYEQFGFYTGGEEPKIINPLYPSSTNLVKGETKFRAYIEVPDTPGEYELVYQTLTQKDILLRKKVTITKPQISLDFDKKIKVGEKLKVTGTRDTNGKYDQIGFYTGGDEPKLLNSMYMNSGIGEWSDIKISLDTPSEPGTYKIVYRSKQDKNILFSGEIEVIQ